MKAQASHRVDLIFLRDFRVFAAFIFFNEIVRELVFLQSALNVETLDLKTGGDVFQSLCIVAAFSFNACQGFGVCSFK
ncbi:hypothetical protein D3C87_2113420 [compost metagenome]